MVTDGSGNTVSLHDYLPWGEEIPAGVGGRGALYGATDAVTQRFTGQLRDSETGLDFFGARYMSSAQGRFTSPDPMIIDQARLLDPQQWNMYAYVRNNPLRFIDPLGLYTCADEKKCAEFEKARQEALKSKDTDVVRSANAYGALGKDNGVAVTFADKLKGDRGGTVSPRGTGIEQDPNSPNGLRAAVDVTIKSSEAGNQEVLVHEGSHTADRQDFVNAITPAGIMDQSLNITLRQSEIRAYTLSIGYAQRGNQTLNFGPCGVMGECKFPPGMMPAQRDSRIIDLLNDSRNNYKNPNSVLFPWLK